MNQTLDTFLYSHSKFKQADRDSEDNDGGGQSGDELWPQFVRSADAHEVPLIRDVKASVPMQDKEWKERYRYSRIKIYPRPGRLHSFYIRRWSQLELFYQYDFSAQDDHPHANDKANKVDDRQATHFSHRLTGSDPVMREEEQTKN